MMLQTRPENKAFEANHIRNEFVRLPGSKTSCGSDTPTSSSQSPSRSSSPLPDDHEYISIPIYTQRLRLKDTALGLVGTTMATMSLRDTDFWTSDGDAWIRHHVPNT